MCCERLRSGPGEGSGSSPTTLHFRDKTLMKRVVSAAGIAVAPHREVRSALELHDAVAEARFTRAWSNPRTVADPLACQCSTMRRHCAAFAAPARDQGRTSPWLVEAFQSGEQYRVDGVCRDGRVIYAAAQRSTSTPTLTSSAADTWAPSCFLRKARRHRPS